jgi:hypothetical protein
MHAQEELELKFLEKKILEDNHYSNIFNNPRFRGWYKFSLTENFCNHFFCIFRLPPAIPLYDNVLKKFSDEERKAGLHRFLIGKDLINEVQELMQKFNGDINECVSSLENDQVNDLLGRLQKIITFDCNRIPYIYIKTIENDLETKIDINQEVKNHILSLPNYLEIFYDVLNEKISVEKAFIDSKGIIYNEYSEYLKNRKES